MSRALLFLKEPQSKHRFVFFGANPRSPARPVAANGLQAGGKVEDVEDEVRGPCNTHVAKEKQLWHRPDTAQRQNPNICNGQTEKQASQMMEEQPQLAWHLTAVSDMKASKLELASGLQLVESMFVDFGV